MNQPQPTSSVIFSPDVPVEDRRLIRRLIRSLPAETRADVVNADKAPQPPKRRRLINTYHSPYRGGPFRNFDHFLFVGLLSSVLLQVSVPTSPWIAAVQQLNWWVMPFLFLVSLASLPIWRMKDPDYHARAAAFRHRDQFILVSSLAEDGRALLRRAQKAIGAIIGSQAHRAGKLDDIANRVVLDAQRWEITRKLATIGGLSRELIHFDPAGSSLVAERIQQQQNALAASTRSVERRVIALEAYASQIAEYDAQLAEADQLAQLDQQDERLLDLLADGARDALAVRDVEHLADGAAAAREAVAASLAAVRECGLSILSLGDGLWEGGLAA